VRAEYYRLTDQPEKALDDLKHAVNLPGATSDLRAAYLWTLVDYGTDAQLDATLKRWRGTEDRSAALWEPYAAAEMRLNRPVRALDYLRRESASLSRDPLWLMTYADAQEMAGRPDLAWSIRHKVWQQLQQDEAALAKLHGAARAAQRGRSGQDAETLADIRGRRVTLSTDFQTGDDSAAMLNDLLSGTQSTESVKLARRSLLGTAKGLPGAAPEAGIDTAQNNRLRDAVAKDVAIAWGVSRALLSRPMRVSQSHSRKTIPARWNNCSRRSARACRWTIASTPRSQPTGRAGQSSLRSTDSTALPTTTTCIRA
jgi:hypothetical protein